MTLIVERDGPVMTVIINRPEVKNAINLPTAALLKQAFLDFEAGDEFAVAVICGVGDSFCSGWDLKSLAADDEPVSTPEGDGALGPSRMTFSKPIIAAVEGYAVAGGLELALLADLRVMAEDAVMGVFCRRWGVPLIDGGTVRLPRLIGMGHAMDLILTGRPVGAEEALGMGLCNRVVANGESRRAAEELARQIAAFPQICMRADRASAYRQWDLDFDQALLHEGRGGQAALDDEARQGAARFAVGKGRGGDFSDI
jgi:enoyl-CoA hydratase